MAREVPPAVVPEPLGAAEVAVRDRAPASRRRLLWAAVVLAAASAAFAGFGVRAFLAGRSAADRGSYTLDRDGYRYVFHAVTGDEGLFDVARDPQLLRNLIREERDRADRMRRALQRHEGVESLDQLRDRERDTILSLRALGYL